jgi:hypothetical protein
MAHFAELNENNIVQKVIVIDNKDCLDANGVESEEVGAAFCHNLFGGIWKQTSYNANFRKNYAGIGYTYDSSKDAFISPKPFDTWIFNEETCQWDPPTSPPVDGKFYIWNNNKGEWEESGLLN